MAGPRRPPWLNEYDGSLSSEWVLALIIVAILAAGAFGFWFQDMYANHYGIFGP